MLCCMNPLYAQAEPGTESKKDSSWNQWNLRLSPYVWLLGIKGEISVAPEPSQLPYLPPPTTLLPSGYSVYDIDLSFPGHDL